MMDILWTVLAVIFWIIGLACAAGRIDDWSDPNHKIGQHYRKTYTDS
jgi:hypothetical protein